MEPGSDDKPIRYCVGRTCSLTGLCIQVQEALKEHFDADQIAPRQCMKLCRRAGAFSLYGHMFTSWDLDQLDQLAADVKACDPADFEV